MVSKIAGDLFLVLSIILQLVAVVLVKKGKKLVARSTCLGKYNSW